MGCSGTDGDQEGCQWAFLEDRVSAGPISRGSRVTTRGEGSRRQAGSRAAIPLSSSRGRGGRGSSAGVAEETPRRSSRLQTHGKTSRKRRREEDSTEDVESSGGDGDDSVSDENFRVEPAHPTSDSSDDSSAFEDE